jgi:hypothetical protein
MKKLYQILNENNKHPSMSTTDMKKTFRLPKNHPASTMMIDQQY